MKLLRILLSITFISFFTGGILAGCDLFQAEGKDIHKREPSPVTNDPNDKTETTGQENENPIKDNSQDTENQTGAEKTNQYTNAPKVEPTKYHDKAIQVVADPKDVTVLVNKQYKLPDQYAPDDLVYPDVRFIFSEKIEKRKLRKVAAKALEKLFAAAEKDGIYLAGASGYRSQETQATLYNNYVKKDGKEKADRYSGRPGHSEHQTGLAIDVSGSSGECAVEDCFADTAEAKWLANHAHEYGFIIRYPKGKENLTGYMYEPWHIRYVGNEIAKEIYEKDITLEEYYNVAIPVNEE
ncbi:M15 family metallopeptidase [Lederbergia sp. NSJ-179]|uniref:M15 family metallopeptidase n=1 Tax=Lederbergia sp. NSJ-179 TaxID=2931402 RepID=UPI001FD2A29D|nr:M15 family metallopeptidase [Lederbergia sp. NSJ-179]MCJ7840041.1 M15 family metallopeptidase [Lederbergia sp. NSJ-179]